MPSMFSRKTTSTLSLAQLTGRGLFLWRIPLNVTPYWVIRLLVGTHTKCDDNHVFTGQVPQDLSHSHYSGLTVKNAIVDQFRSRNGRRPDVDIDDPDLPVVTYLHRGEAILYRVWSGDASMHKRGYRETVHRYC